MSNGRRCGWCGRYLRMWQFNYCRSCGSSFRYKPTSSPFGGCAYEAPDKLSFRLKASMKDAR